MIFYIRCNSIRWNKIHNIFQSKIEIYIQDLDPGNWFEILFIWDPADEEGGGAGTTEDPAPGWFGYCDGWSWREDGGGLFDWSSKDFTVSVCRGPVCHVSTSWSVTDASTVTWK